MAKLLCALLLLSLSLMGQNKVSRVFNGSGVPQTGLCSSNAHIGNLYLNREADGLSYICRKDSTGYFWSEIVFLGRTGAASVAASGVTVTPAGAIAATNVQTALTELDTEKVAGAASLTTAGRIAYIASAGTLTQSSAWSIATGHLLAVTDNLYDIGASGATRPRHIYAAGNGVFGGTVTVGANMLDPTSGLRGPSSQLIALAAGMVLPAATAPALTTITGTNTEFEVLDFADADGDYAAQFAFPLPYFSTITATLRWRAAAAATGSVVWQVLTACAAAGESGDPAFNAAQTVTDAASAGTELNDASIASVTTTGCAAGETMFLKVLRNRTHASDDLNQKPQLVSVKLVFN